MLLQCVDDIYFDYCVLCGMVLLVLCCELPVLVIRDHQENRDLRDKLERKGPQDQLVFLVLMDHVVILVLM